MSDPWWARSPWVSKGRARLCQHECRGYKRGVLIYGVIVYAEKYIGFWLSFTLPTILFIFCPIVLITFKGKYVRRPPTGSVLGKATGLFFLALKKNRYRLHSKTGFVSKYFMNIH